MKHHPPAFGLWLLRVWGGRYATDAFTGDLIEAYQIHRSAYRFWWEVLNAICHNAVAVARDNAPSFVTGLACAWLLLFASGYARVYIEPGIKSLAKEMLWLFGFGETGKALSWLVSMSLLTAWFASTSALQGFVIGRLHRAIPRAAAIVFFLAFILLPQADEFSTRLANAFRYPNGAWLESLYLPTYFSTVILVFLLLGSILASKRALPRSQVSVRA